MIKKRLVFILIIFLLILLISLFPLINSLDAEKIENYSGELDPETGLPSNLNPLADTGEKFAEGEITTKYLKQEWTKILEKSEFGKYFIGFLNFTEKIFSFFNPLWKYTFGTEFSWTWGFFISLLIWVSIIIILYSPSKAFTDINPLFTLLFAIVVACLAGSGGVISKATELLSFALSNIWLVGLSILIAVLLLAFYYKFFGDLEKEMKKESDKEKRKRAQKSIESAGEVAEEFLRG